MTGSDPISVMLADGYVDDQPKMDLSGLSDADLYRLEAIIIRLDGGALLADIADGDLEFLAGIPGR